MNLKPIKNSIIFQFIDKIENGKFVEKTQWGFFVPGSVDDTTKQARWGRVVCVGPKCSEELQQKQLDILVEPLAWTEGITFDGQTFWRTNETKVLAYRHRSE